MIWDRERVEELKALWAEGVTARVIAETFGDGCTRNAVIGKASRLGLMTHAKYRGTPNLDRVRKGFEYFGLSSRTCQFPLWGHDGPPTHEYCSNSPVPGRPYCEEHLARCYRQKGTPEEEATV